MANLIGEYDLKPEDAAVVFKTDGEIILLLPKDDEDDDAPNHLVLAAAVAIGLQRDSELCDKLIKDFEERAGTEKD